MEFQKGDKVFFSPADYNDNFFRGLSIGLVDEYRHPFGDRYDFNTIVNWKDGNQEGLGRAWVKNTFSKEQIIAKINSEIAMLNNLLEFINSQENTK